jgi:hypothetical protein
VNCYYFHFEQRDASTDSAEWIVRHERDSTPSSHELVV